MRQASVCCSESAPNVPRAGPGPQHPRVLGLRSGRARRGPVPAVTTGVSDQVTGLRSQYPILIVPVSPTRDGASVM